MSSFIQPVRPIDTAPPWDWNPGQTFVTAFNQTSLAQAESEKLRLANELETFLIPLKQKKAAFDLDKIQYETELQSVVLDRARQAQRQSYRDEISRAKGLGGNNAPATNAQGFQSKFGWGSKIATPPQAASRPKLTWQVVAPAQPNPTGP
jgi:hypothetical protein